MIRAYLNTLFCVVTILLSLRTNAQSDSISLRVGRKAPLLAPYKWLKGSPVNEFRKGVIYIVEFGATWCTPCRRAIPELSKLADKYRGKVEVMSFFVMENSSYEPVDTKNPSFIPRVEKYVLDQGDKIRYTVGMDGIQSTMQDTWLKSAGKVGVPGTFVIDREGRIAWIGANAELLDSIITIVSAPDYSIATMMVEKPENVSQHAEGITQNPLKLIDVDPKNELLYVSLLTRYKEGQDQTNSGGYNMGFISSLRWASNHPGWEEIASHQGKIQVIGESLRRLYFMAYGDTTYNNPPTDWPQLSGIYPDTLLHPNRKNSYGRFWYRPLLELKDSSAFDFSFRKADNRYNYYLKMPLAQATARCIAKKDARRP